MLRVLALITTLVLLLPALAGGVQAAVAAHEQDWNLAVVLDPSATDGGPWLGADRRETLEQALRLALAGLPLRVEAAVWAGGIEPLLAPRPAGELQPQAVSLPAVRAGNGTDSLEAAGRWLRSRGGGTILLAAGSGFKGPLPLPSPEVFVQVLALEPGPAETRLREAAAAGGGLYCQTDRPEALTRLLRRTLQSAVSTASLTLLTYDRDNQPLRLKLRVERSNPKWPPSAAYSGRPIQLPPGAWRLTWPGKTGLSLRELPEKADLDRGEQARVWVGGRGELAVKGQGPKGAPLDWRVQVSRPRDGRLMTAGYQPLPLMLSLPGGLYRVSSLKPSHQWLVEVGAGAKASVTVGPPGHLLVEQPGPGGDLRLGFRALSRLSGREAAAGHSGRALSLPPGPYVLELEPSPPRRREVIIDPGGDTVVTLEPIGLLHLERGGAGSPAVYQVRTPSGRIVARGAGERRIPLLPGEYLLALSSGETPRRLVIKAGQAVKIKLP